MEGWVKNNNKEIKEFHIPSPAAIIALCPSEEHNLSFVVPVS